MITTPRKQTSTTRYCIFPTFSLSHRAAVIIVKIAEVEVSTLSSNSGRWLKVVATTTKRVDRKPKNAR